MAEQSVRIASTQGLHARPAAIFTQAVAASGVPVKLLKGGTSVNAASILAVLSLGINHGDEVTLSAEGADGERIVRELVVLLSSDLDEN